MQPVVAPSGKLKIAAIRSLRITRLLREHRCPSNGFEERRTHPCRTPSWQGHHPGRPEPSSVLLFDEFDLLVTERAFSASRWVQRRSAELLVPRLLTLKLTNCHNPKCHHN